MCACGVCVCVCACVWVWVGGYVGVMLCLSFKQERTDMRARYLKLPFCVIDLKSAADVLNASCSMQLPTCAPKAVSSAASLHCVDECNWYVLNCTASELCGDPASLM